MDFHLAEIDLTSDPGAPLSRLWDGVTAVERAVTIDTFGYDDFATTDNLSRVAALQDDRETRHAVVLAVAGPAPERQSDPSPRPFVPATGDAYLAPEDVLGAVVVEAPTLDNEHLGYLDPFVHPESRRHGIGTALLDAGERILTAWGRTTTLVWAVVTPAVSDETSGTILDPSGTIRLRTDEPKVRFALARGYAFSQAERHSVQPLPVPPDVLDSAMAEAGAKAAGYELVSFIGQPPEELAVGLAPLFAGMSTDPPLGAVDWRPEVWDADRVVRAYEQMARGTALYTTVARHLATGEVVAFTQLKGPYDKPAVVFQENTLVLRGHRGHALGLWAKAANCFLIQRERPTSRRVHTWNADENDHMLTINARLGYRRANIAAAWQKVAA
ncbi:MAG TPA: GNAT family N-acetyltransferase [Propionibacteriaceae bacterium]|nr:GNAT family N-acetyltransferase [Propionibacteriaceae bacterium]